MNEEDIFNDNTPIVVYLVEDADGLKRYYTASLSSIPTDRDRWLKATLQTMGGVDGDKTSLGTYLFNAERLSDKEFVYTLEPPALFD